MGFRDWARREFKKGEDQRYARELGALAEAKKESTARGKTAVDTQRSSCKKTVDSVRVRADQTFQQDVSKARKRRAAAVQPAKECCAAEALQIKDRTRGQKEQLEQRRAQHGRPGVIPTLLDEPAATTYAASPRADLHRGRSAFRTRS
jgi:hypothetical protein